MQIGIVKERYNKKTRWFYYIVMPLILIAIYPLLLILNFGLTITWILFSIVTIISLIIIDKVIDSIIIIGKIEIGDKQFKITLDKEVLTISFDKIKCIILNPKLGLSKLPHTFKVYQCQIKTIESDYKFDITREELRNGKIISKNILASRAFDLIKFLEKKKILYKIEKRVY